MTGLRFLVAEGGGYALPAALAEALMRRGEMRTRMRRGEMRTRMLRNAGARPEAVGVRPKAARGKGQGTARPGR